MIGTGSRAILALSLLAAAAGAAAQDTASAPVVHRLAVDTTRIRPFSRMYDMLLRTVDTTDTIGTRVLTLQPSSYASSPAWLLVEERSGAVPSVDSLFVTPDLLPMHWSSALGLARLALEFVGDSVYGAITTPASRQNVVIAARQDLLVSTAYLELALSTLPLAVGWADSASALGLDAVSHTVDSVTMAVVGEEELSFDSTATPVYVVALRSERGNTLFWVDRLDGRVLRVMQSVPSHVGVALEFRPRQPTAHAQLPP